MRHLLFSLVYFSSRLLKYILKHVLVQFTLFLFLPLTGSKIVFIYLHSAEKYITNRVPKSRTYYVVPVALVES